MIVTLGSVSGSPGVSSWSLLLAAAWPTEYGVERAVLEADGDGGVYGARYGLGVDPGVVSLIASLRGGAASVPVEDHGRSVAEGLWLVPGPESSERARSVWANSADTVAECLANDARVWIVDAGRLNFASTAQPFVDYSALTVIVTRCEQASLVQLPSRVKTLAERCPNVGLLVTGKSKYPLEEIAAFTDCRHTWAVGQHDELVDVAAALLAPGRARRLWLWRTAVETAAKVAAVAQAAGRGSDVDEWTIERSVR